MQLITEQGDAFIVDPDIYEEIKDVRATTLTYNYKKYKKKYVRLHINGKSILLHRYILGIKKGLDVDHKDNDSMNNLRSNLRHCTRFQNQANRRSCNKTSKYKGVSWCKANNKWVSQITKNGKTRKMGRFDCQIKAAKAYDKEAIRVHGEFARTNKDLGLL